MAGIALQMWRRFWTMVTVLLSVTSCNPGVMAQACRPGVTEIIVATSQHRLLLCDQGSVSATYRIRLGKKGVGKTKANDGKTPLGTYALGVPRTSQQFTNFIPIEYPTAEQKKQGFTGGAIGIHGTQKRFQWLGALTAYIDTTDGCVAVATDHEIQSIARWVKEKKARTIHLTE